MYALTKKQAEIVKQTKKRGEKNSIHLVPLICRSQGRRAEREGTVGDLTLDCFMRYKQALSLGTNTVFTPSLKAGVTEHALASFSPSSDSCAVVKRVRYYVLLSLMPLDLSLCRADSAYRLWRFYDRSLSSWEQFFCVFCGGCLCWWGNIAKLIYL